MEINELERLLEGAVETPQLDFKESCPWEVRSFAKDILAMSNIADGGRLVIGVEEKPKGIFARVGITTADKKTYQVDIMKDQLAKYADPFVELSVSFPKDSKGLEFCVIRVDPFKEVPVICKIPDQAHGLFAGGIYYRNRNKKVESALVSNFYDMRDIVERAMLKMRYRARQIGYPLPVATEHELAMKAMEEYSKKFEKERGDL